MKALIAMSGGVDSSVAAGLMKDAGFECMGCTMKLYNNENAAVPEGKTCCSLDDIQDARSVATRLDMPYYVFNFTDDFKEKIIGKFISCYEQAMTPNPCIDCNRYMKFGLLHNRAKELGCDYVVTGHYARIAFEDGKYKLKKSLNPDKDQSYVLYSVTQDILAHTKFPLGELSKAEVRELASKYEFINAEKPDSQDICFVPDGDYARVIEENTGKTYEPGDFVDHDGNVLGTHKGLIHYTIGQRKGLGIAAKAPLYVCELCPSDNTVILGSNDDLFTKEALVTDVNWISGESPKEAIHVKAKVRYRMTEQPVTIIPLENNEVKLVFDEPQRAITPGQAAVFYDGDDVLGGGVIVRQ